jgi:hypothetical protein
VSEAEDGVPLRDDGQVDVGTSDGVHWLLLSCEMAVRGSSSSVGAERFLGRYGFSAATNVT